MTTASRCADTSFGLAPQAWALLHMLSAKEPFFAPYVEATGRYMASIQTYPWYNGREMGVALVVSKDGVGPCKVITFGENRNSDHLFVEHWSLDECPTNGLHIDLHQSEETSRALFQHGRLNDAMSYIIDVMEEFYGSSSNVVPLFPSAQ